MSNGALQSPEYLKVQFLGSVDDHHWAVNGVLDPQRSPDNETAVIAKFLDEIRGQRPENRDLAAGWAGRFWSAPYSDQGQAEFDARTSLPSGDLQLNRTIDRLLDADGKPVSSEQFVHGPWAYQLNIPTVSWNGNDYVSQIWVDRLDEIVIVHNSLQNRSNATIEAQNLLANLDLSLDDAVNSKWSYGTGYVC